MSEFTPSKAPKSTSMDAASKNAGKSPKQPGTKMPNQKKGIIALIVLAVVAVIIIVAVAMRGGDDADITEEEDLNSYARLNGELATESQKDAWVIGLMIENLASDSVRPQPGLGDADVVYETLAEGGITRFLALYQGAPEDTPKLGPIRSARDYYLEFVSEYDALYGHMGGSPQALEAISGLGLKDLDGMYVGSSYYERDRSIAAPHNLFTTGEKLSFALRDNDLDQLPATYDPWRFQDSAAPDDRGEGKDVSIDFSSAAYVADWEYDVAANEYLRSNGGQPHLDGNTQEQISAMNVAIQVVPPVKVLDAKGRLQMDIAGEGKGYVMQNGDVIEGTWKKPSRTERTRFYDANGEEVAFVRGTTWVEVVPEDREVTFSN